MRKLVRASLSSTIASPRDLARQSSSTRSPGPTEIPSNQSKSNSVSIWASQIVDTSPENITCAHWLVLLPYRFHDHGFKFPPIIRECREEETRIVIKRFTKHMLSTNEDIHAPEVGFVSKVVSRVHAEIWCGTDGEFYIRDVSSSSGTFLNRKRLSDSGQSSSVFPLKDGDILQLGIEYNDGIEMADRAVKMRVVIGRGRKKMQYLRPELPQVVDPTGAVRIGSPENPQRADSPSSHPFEDAPSLDNHSNLAAVMLGDSLSFLEGSLVEEDKGAANVEQDGSITSFQPSQSSKLPSQVQPEEVSPPRYHTPSPTTPIAGPETENQAPPFSPSTSHQSSFTELTLYENDLSRYASQHRQYVSPELELKLRRAHYMPEDDPDEISAQEWQNEHGVGYFELKRLRQLYSRNFGERHAEG